MRNQKFAGICVVFLIALLGLHVTAQDTPEIADLVDLETVEADYTGLIDGATPYFEIPFNVRRTGSTIVIDLYKLSGDLDTLLFLVDGAGNIVASNDDRSSESRDSLVRFPQAAAGQYRAVATRYKIERGSTRGQFAMNIDVEEDPEVIIDPPVTRGALIDAGFPEIEVRPEAEWAVLAYYGGDTNLEPFIINDLNELERGGGSTDRVHVVAMMDRHPEHYNNPDPEEDWDTTRIYEITGSDNPAPEPGEVASISSRLIADLGTRNTGAGVNLAQFLVWAIRNYPAQNYIIALASHGAGWQGVITDETAARNMGLEDYSIITVPEIRGAFQAALNESGHDRFALLVNDACYMSSVEYYGAINEFFDFSYGSAEIVVNPALDMSLLLDSLQQQYNAENFRALGQRLIDQYIDVDSQLTRVSDVVYLTNSVTRMSDFGAVAEAVEAFAAVVNEQPDTRIAELARARGNTYTYSAYSGLDTLVDVGHLMRRVLIETRDEDLAAAASDVLEALDESLVYGRSGPRAADYTSQYNIYFPNYREDFRAEYFDQTTLGEWSRMLRNYYNYFTPEPWTGDRETVPFHPPVSPEIRVTDRHPDGTMSLRNPGLSGVEIVGRNITYVDVTTDRVMPDGSAVRVAKERLLLDTVENGEFVRLSKYDDGVNQLNIGWDGALPQVTDGDVTHDEFLTITDEIATLEGRYREPGGETWYDVVVMFPRDGGSSERIINRSESTGATAVIDIPINSEFQTFVRNVSADGREIREEGNVYTWGANGLSWSMEPAPNGNYRVGALVTAFGGSTGFAETQYEVDNTGLPADLRASTRLDLGVTLTHPDSWNRLAFFNPPFVWRTANEGGTQNKTIYLPYPEDQTPDEIMARILELYPDIQPDGEPEPITVQGIDGLRMDYTVTDADGVTYDGRGFTTNTGFGLFIAAEVAQDSDGDLDALWDDLLESTSLFEAIPPNVRYENQWAFDSGPDPENEQLEFVYPVRGDWLANRTKSGAWLRYAPAADSNSFIATARFNVQSQLLGNPSALASLITGYAVQDVDKLVITGTNALTAKNHEWQTTLYEAERGDVSVIGRVYVTVANNRAYAIWVETPLDDTRFELLPQMEITVDGASIQPTELDPPPAEVMDASS